MNYEQILKRMMVRVPNDLDKREGSVMYNALAPAAAELAQMHIEIGVIFNEIFADTASRPYLIRRAAESGLVPYRASQAVLKGEFNKDIPIGSRFSINKLNYIAIEKISEGKFKMQCETSGTIGNSGIGRLIPIEYIEGLAFAKTTEVLIPGEDEENTESFRTRYLMSKEQLSRDGTEIYYREKLLAIDGVGSVKVYPVWHGGGTVRLVVLDALFNALSDVFIKELQNLVDPLPQGYGKGIAPIGHSVTVNTAVEKIVNIESNITYASDIDQAGVKSNIIMAIESYFNELCSEWSDASNLIVRISQIENKILDTTGVLDVADTKLNGSESNIKLASDQVPIRGDFIG